MYSFRWGGQKKANCGGDLKQIPLRGKGEKGMGTSGGRTFQIQGTTHANALR